MEPTEPSDLYQEFIVDLADGNFICVRAVGAYNLEGDLIFGDHEGNASDMIAKGHWKRCKLASLVEKL